MESKKLYPGNKGSKSGTYLLLQGDLVVQIGDRYYQIATKGIDSNTSYDETPEPIDSLLEILKERLNSRRRKPTFSLENQSSFVPLSFLETGAKRSQAVCRIARYFSLVEFEKLIEAFKKAPNIADYTAANLISILEIPDELAVKIFKQRFEQLGQLEQQSEQQLTTEKLREVALEDLEALSKISSNLLARINPIALGTGFLVGGSHLMTNNHVVPTPEDARDCVAQFNYAEDVSGKAQQVVEYELHPDFLFVTNPKLDYTLVQLRAGGMIRQAGYQFGWLQLNGNSENVCPGVNLELPLNQKIREKLKKQGYQDEDSEEVKAGDRLYLIQHPKGRRKEFVPDADSVLDYADKGLLRNFLRYKTRADFGSSGSPVFNDRWELVALHHAAIPKDLPKLPSDQSPVANALPPIEAYQGIRICRIVEDLQRKSVQDSKLKSFIEDFVVTSEQLNYPPLPSGLEFNGTSDYICLDTEIAFVSCLSDIAPRHGDIKLWNQSGIPLKTLAHPQVTDVWFNSDGQTLISRSMYDGTVRLWSLDSYQCIRELQIEQGDNAINLNFSPDGKLIAIGSGYNIRIWEISDLLEEPTPSAISLQGKFELWNDIVVGFGFPASDALIVVHESGSIELFSSENLTSSTSSKLLRTDTKNIKDLSFNASHKTLAILYEGGIVELIVLDHNSEESIASTIIIEGDENVIGIGFNLHNDTLNVAKTNSVQIWSARSNSLLREIPLQQGKIQPNQKVLISAQGDTLLMNYLDLKVKSILQLWKLEESGYCPIRSFEHSAGYQEDGTKELSIALNPKYIYNPKINEPFASDSYHPITVEAWICPFGEDGTVFSSFLSTVFPFYGYSLEVIWGERISFRTPCGASATALVPLHLGEFAHIAATFDGKEAAIYFNGQRQEKPFARSLPEGNAQPFCPSPILIGASLENLDFYAGTSELNIPDIEYGQAISNFFKGIIAEVRIWNVSRSDAQIKTTMFRRIDPQSEEVKGLTHYWRLEEGQGKILYDLTSKSLQGQVCGGEWSKAAQMPSLPIKVGLQFSKNNDYIDVGCIKPDSSTVLTGITVEAWIKYKFGNCLIVSQGNPTGCYYSIRLQDSKLRVLLQGKDGKRTTVVETEEYFPKNQIWHHIAFTWEQDSSEVSIYINGRLQNLVVIEGYSRTISAPERQTYGLFTESLDLTGALKIGGQQTEQKLQEKNVFYDVVISDVRLWNACCSQGKIKANMSRRLDAKDWNPKQDKLLGYWRLDEGYGDQVTNLVSEAGSTVTGARWFPSSPPSEEDASNKEHNHSDSQGSSTSS